MLATVQPIEMPKGSILGYVDKANVLVILICASDAEENPDNYSKYILHFCQSILSERSSRESEIKQEDRYF